MDINKLIKELGGTNALAKKINLTPGAVSQWKKNGMSHPWRMYFEAKYPKLWRECSQEKEEEKEAE